MKIGWWVTHLLPLGVLTIELSLSQFFPNNFLDSSFPCLILLQAVFKQFGGHGGSEFGSDNADVQQHQKLERLYISTRAGKVLLRPLMCSIL